MYLVAIMDTIIYLYRPQQLISFRKTSIFLKDLLDNTKKHPLFCIRNAFNKFQKKF